ncbi:MAG: hypothetical protein IT292_06085 [Deltaproteobacteria bacterium]|nr:hypothetical protein [Deltaproteobacteria bacterium]
MLSFRKLGLSRVAAKLQESLDLVLEQQKNFADVNHTAVLVILEEDIKSLLDECRLIREGNIRRHSALKSFYLRAMTAVEETQCFHSPSPGGSSGKLKKIHYIHPHPKGEKPKLRSTIK